MLQNITINNRYHAIRIVRLTIQYVEPNVLIEQQVVSVHTACVETY